MAGSKITICFSLTNKIREKFDYDKIHSNGKPNLRAQIILTIFLIFADFRAAILINVILIKKECILAKTYDLIK